MGIPNAVHHVAMSTGDVKKQIEFFSDVLGMELVGLFWMHGVENAWHAFMKLGDSSFAFVFVPGNEGIAATIGETHAGHGGGQSAPGTMQHIALNVDTMTELLLLRDRIRSKGVPVFGPMNHGFCHSMYFAGPENLALELATADTADYKLDDNGTWIDPEVVALAGISEEELARFQRPAPYSNDGERVPQPDFDESKPHLHYPEGIYPMMLGMPDEVIAASFPESASVPPPK